MNADASLASRDYCAPFLAALPVTGAAISTLGDLVSPETVCASDRQAALLDELQFDLGEGPCWDASASRRPVIEPDIRSAPSGNWPAFIEALQDTTVRAMFAFPLMLGPINLGVIDLYSESPGSLHTDQERTAAGLAEAATRRLLHQILSRLDTDPAVDEPPSEFSRRRIHQATGAVIAQLRISAQDAALVIRAHAFSTSRSLRDVAEDILTWKLDFSTGAGES
jgi:hypothetical protein